MRIEDLKEKYQKDWKRFQKEFDYETAEKLFLEFAKAKEKMRKAKEKLQMQKERTKKREARALIILSKLILKKYPQLVAKILRENEAEFVKKEGKKEVDYSQYVMNLLKKQIERKE